MRNATIYFFLILVLISCEELQEVQPLTPNSSALQGNWELKSATCFCFFPENFDFGAHQLTFNTTANEVIVQNSEDTFFIADPGVYPILVENDIMTIKDSLEYTFAIKNDTLILNYTDNPQIADDEITLSYLKN